LSRRKLLAYPSRCSGQEGSRYKCRNQNPSSEQSLRSNIQLTHCKRLPKNKEKIPRFGWNDGCAFLRIAVRASNF